MIANGNTPAAQLKTVRRQRASFLALKNGGVKWKKLQY